MLRRATGLLLLLLAWPGLTGCDDDRELAVGQPRSGQHDELSAPAAPPNIILIVIDNLRADHLGAYGYDRPTSPYIDGLAAAGLLFRNAFAPSSWTKPSIGSLFTSKYPSEHRAISFARHLDDRIPTLAEAMQAAGYVTMGYAGNFVHVRPETGMARGFDHWETVNVELAPDEPGEALWVEPTPDGRQARMRPPRTHEINNPLSRKLQVPVEGPLFLYVHYMEPHASYDPPEAWRKKFVRDPAYVEAEGFGTTEHIVELARGRRRPGPGELERLVDLYDAEVASADSGVGVLLRRLRRSGLLRNSVIAVVSDHGEAFAEHGTWFHGGNLHHEQMAVPFILADMRPDRVVPAGEVDERAVDLLDVPTTLLALAGIAPPAGMRGRDLLADRAPARDLVAELHPDPDFEDHFEGREHRLVYTRWPHKLVLGRDGSAVQYDLANDPAELRPGKPVPAVEAGGRAIEAELDRALEAALQTPAAPLDEQTREGLRALGYIE
jgi:arylsulfatase A-like enzyme